MQMRRLALRLADMLGANRLLSHRRRGVLALAYHGVEERLVDPRVQTLHLPLDRFESHVRLLADRFEVISCPDLRERLAEGRGLDGRQVVLTFDDGYRNNHRVVQPLLESLGLPFAVFVCTDHVGTAHRLPTYLLRTAMYYTEARRAEIPTLGLTLDLSTEDARARSVLRVSQGLKSSPQTLVERTLEELRGLLPPDRWAELDSRFASDAILSWEELARMQAQGVAIGSHGRSHVILHARQELDVVHDQIGGSRRLLGERLGSCRFFAYPNGNPGDVGRPALEAVRAAGYELGFTGAFGEIRAGIDPHLLPRVDGDEDLDTLKFFLHTAFHPRRGMTAFSR
jgi:peptidoglycan/xylan/chitin deacetylase (PgdA/CDA1 family)